MDDDWSIIAWFMATSCWVPGRLLQCPILLLIPQRIARGSVFPQSSAFARVRRAAVTGSARDRLFSNRPSFLVGACLDPMKQGERVGPHLASGHSPGIDADQKSKCKINFWPWQRLFFSVHRYLYEGLWQSAKDVEESGSLWV